MLQRQCYEGLFRFKQQVPQRFKRIAKNLFELRNKFALVLFLCTEICDTDIAFIAWGEGGVQHEIMWIEMGREQGFLGGRPVVEEVGPSIAFPAVDEPIPWTAKINWRG